MTLPEFDLKVKRPLLSNSRVLVMHDLKTRRELASLTFERAGHDAETGEVRVSTTDLKAKDPEHAKALLDEMQKILRAMTAIKNMPVLHSHVIPEGREGEEKILDEAGYLKIGGAAEPEVLTLLHQSTFNKRVSPDPKAEKAFDYLHGIAFKLFTETGR